MKNLTTKLNPYVDSVENRKKLFDFYKAVYPDAPWLLEESRFEWQNLSNPLQADSESAIWLLADDAVQLIGQNIYIFYNLSIGEKPYRGFCSTNLIVKPGIVGKGYGHKMIEKNESLPGVAYAVGITPASTRAFIKRGWKLVEDARLMNKIINPIPNLKYLKMPGWKILLLAPLLKAAAVVFDLFSYFRAVRKFNGITVKKISHFEPEWDQYWEKYLKEFAIHFERNHDTLNYKYCSREDVQHKRVLFEKDNVPAGYAVFRVSENKLRKLKLGRIVDIVYNPELGGQFLNYIIHYVKNELKSSKVDALVGVAADKEISEAYKANGFFLSRDQAAIIKEEDFALEELRLRYKSLWYITLGDSDLDNYW